MKGDEGRRIALICNVVLKRIMVKLARKIVVVGGALVDIS